MHDFQIACYRDSESVTFEYPYDAFSCGVGFVARSISDYTKSVITVQSKCFLVLDLGKFVQKKYAYQLAYLGSVETPHGNVEEPIPMDGNCQARCIVYKAEVEAGGDTKENVGLTEPPFKQRYTCHMSSFRHAKHEHSTELSKHVWDLKRRGEDFSTRWSILTSAPAYNSASKRCNLCLSEKLHIVLADKKRSLNKRTELISKCRHENKHLLVNQTLAPD